MSTVAYIYSTLTGSNEYVKYKPNSANELPIREFSVIIKGGAGLAPKRAGLVTPYGVRTAVTREQFDFLLNNKTFQAHVDKGWITFVECGGLIGAPPVEAVIGDLAHRDGSSPFVPADYVATKAPRVGNANEMEITTRARQVPLKNGGMFR